MAIYKNISNEQVGISKNRHQVIMQPGDTIDLTVQDLVASGFNRVWLKAVVEKTEEVVEEPVVAEPVDEVAAPEWVDNVAELTAAAIGEAVVAPAPVAAPVAAPVVEEPVAAPAAEVTAEVAAEVADEPVAEVAAETVDVVTEVSDEPAAEVAAETVDVDAEVEAVAPEATAKRRGKKS